jgi:hypothetical protein
MHRGGDAARLRRRAYDVALASETPCYLHSEIDRQLAVGTVGILLPIDKNVMAVRAKTFMRAHKVPNFVQRAAENLRESQIA